jgi:hypothetical protein
MINRVGLSGLVKNVSIPTKNNQQKLPPPYITGRVLDIILNENHPDFQSRGEWNSLGSVKFEIITLDNSGDEKWAKPLIPNIKSYPIINERIIIFSLQIPSLTSNSYTTEYYYLNSISFWNHPHHNAYPNPSTFNQSPSQLQDYQQSNGGVVRRVTDQSTEIELNSISNPSQNSFIEKANIHPLSFYSGDIIFEGRWGNSLRFGSTSKTTSQLSNNWSSNGEDGSPITLLRNGQPPTSGDEGWIPISENITQDLSSIYLTSTQKIPFSIANENFISYTTTPTTPSQYNSPQIILNSDRVVINARKDSVLISGEKSIGIFSNNSINIESTQETILSSKQIKLGDKNANQSVLRGDETVEYLKILITELQNISEALKVIQDWPSGAPTPNPVILTTANSALQVFTNVYNQIDSIKSKIVKTV